MSTTPDTGPDGMGVRQEYAWMDAAGQPCEEEQAVAFWWTGYDSEGNAIASGSGAVTR